MLQLASYVIMLIIKKKKWNFKGEVLICQPSNVISW